MKREINSPMAGRADAMEGRFIPSIGSKIIWHINQTIPLDCMFSYFIFLSNIFLNACRKLFDKIERVMVKIIFVL
jgi:hypothetical protein